MAGYFTQFSVRFPVGDANIAPALALYADLSAELEADDQVIGFNAVDDGGGVLWLHDGTGSGEPEHVITFALRCAEAFSLTGFWGFTWGLSCSRPRIDSFGGGAQLLDLDRRESVTWVDCQHWLSTRLGSELPRPVSARALLQPFAADQGWTRSTQLEELLDALDAVMATDPAIADCLRAHFAERAGLPEDEIPCRECGKPMLTTAEGTSHHAAGHGDGIDHTRDRDHVAIAEREA